MASQLAKVGPKSVKDSEKALTALMNRGEEWGRRWIAYAELEAGVEATSRQSFRRFTADATDTKDGPDHPVGLYTAYLDHLAVCKHDRDDCAIFVALLVSAPDRDPARSSFRAPPAITAGSAAWEEWARKWTAVCEEGGWEVDTATGKIKKPIATSQKRRKVEDFGISFAQAVNLLVSSIRCASFAPFISFVVLATLAPRVAGTPLQDVAQELEEIWPGVMFAEAVQLGEFLVLNTVLLRLADVAWASPNGRPRNSFVGSLAALIFRRSPEADLSFGA